MPFSPHPTFRALTLAALIAGPVVAEDPPTPALPPAPALIAGVPAEAHRTIAEVFRDREWHRPLPKLSRFPLDRGERPFTGITQIGFIDQPGLPQAHRQWVVADATGIHRISALGEVRRLVGHDPEGKLPPGPDATGAFRCLAMSVRPAGSAESNPYALVWAQKDPPGGPGEPAACSIRALGQDGVPRVLYRGLRNAPDEWPTSLGMACFKDVRALALDRQGRVFVADAGYQTVSVLDKDGVVRMVAGDCHGYGARDGSGMGAVFGFLNGMALDPDTGNLYVSDRHSVRCITPGKRVTTLFGRQDSYGRGFAETGSPGVGPAACVNYPRGLMVRDRHLYLADTQNCAVRVFNLDTGVLRTLAGDPAHRETREGLLGHFSPKLPAQACAALGYPVDLACNPEGVCLVACEDGLVELEFPLFEAEPKEPAEGSPCCIIQ